MRTTSAANTLPILVIDVGGTHVKVLASGQKEFREIPSGPATTPRPDGRAGEAPHRRLGL